MGLGQEIGALQGGDDEAGHLVAFEVRRQFAGRDRRLQAIGDGGLHLGEDVEQALPDDRGQPMGTLVYRPEEVYRRVENVAPDLVVHFGALYWRSIGGVGYDELYVQENDTGPDDCNHAQFGAFILSAPTLERRGEVEGLRLLDIAPTLLDLAGEAIPDSMQGTPLR